MVGIRCLQQTASCTWTSIGTHKVRIIRLVAPMIFGGSEIAIFDMELLGRALNRVCLGFFYMYYNDGLLYKSLRSPCFTHIPLVPYAVRGQ